MALTDPKNAKLKVLFDELQADKKTIQDQSAPVRAERDRLLAEIQPTEAKIRELNKQIKKLEMEGPVSLAEIDMQISAIAKAAGGRRLSDGVVDAQMVNADPNTNAQANLEKMVDDMVDSGNSAG